MVKNELSKRQNDEDVDYDGRGDGVVLYHVIYFHNKHLKQCVAPPAVFKGPIYTGFCTYAVNIWDFLE